MSSTAKLALLYDSPISWVRGFSFKPRKLSMVIDLVVANRDLDLALFGSKTLVSPTTSSSARAKPSGENPPYSPFSSGWENLLMWSEQGLESGQERWLAHASSPSLEFKSFHILASHVLERLSRIKTSYNCTTLLLLLGLPCFLEVFLMYVCQPICRSGCGPSHTQLHYRVLVCLVCSCGALVILKNKRDHLFVFILNAPQRAVANIALALRHKSCASLLHHNREMRLKLSGNLISQTHGRQGESEIVRSSNCIVFKNYYFKEYNTGTHTCIHVCMSKESIGK